MPPTDRTDVDVVVAVHHPLRRRLLEILGLDGPATASVLAQRTDQLVGNISHHVKVLARAGLVEEAHELAKDRRERWWRAVPRPVSWSVADVLGDPAGEALLAAAEQQNLAHQVGKVQQWLGAREGYGEEWVRAAFSTDAWIEASAAELDALGEAILALLAPYVVDVVDAAAPRPASDEAARERVFFFAHAVPGRP